LAHVFADAAYDFARAEGFAKEFDGALSSGFRDNVAARAEFVAKLAEEGTSIAIAAVDYWNGELGGHGSRVKKSLGGCWRRREFGMVAKDGREVDHIAGISAKWQSEGR
jgi:hypothetical protein